MNGLQLGQLLTYIALGDNRNADDEMVLRFWWDMVGDLDFEDCRAAVRNHRRTSTEYLQPAHVIAGVKDVQRQRRRAQLEADRQVAAIESGPAFNQRTPAQQAYVSEQAARARAEIAEQLAKVAKKWSLPEDVARERPPLLREPEGAFRADLRERGLA